MNRWLQLLVAVAALAIMGYVAFSVWREMSGSRIAQEQDANDRREVTAFCKDVQNAFATQTKLPRNLSTLEGGKVMSKCYADGYL